MYALALASFVLFYGERDTVYRLHLIGFAAYSALIGYIVVERAERGWLVLAPYTLAMAVHFLIVGHSLSGEHRLQHRSSSRWLLAGSVLAGWLLGSTTQLSEMTFARLYAVLAGGVVINSLTHELPGDRKGRFWPFCLGAVVFALALLASEAALA
jgi:CDP-diglyceride synthetase